MGVFARDGHLLLLGLERHQAEDLGPEERQGLEQHLGDCSLCQSRHARLQQELVLPPLKLPQRPQLQLIPGGAGRGAPPPAAAPTAAPPPSRRRWWLLPVAAMAVGLIVTVLLPRQRSTGQNPGSLAMEVYRDRDSQRLLPGDLVAEGEKLAFRVRSDEDGYLLVSERNGTGQSRPCYPAGDSPQAALLRGGPDAMVLPTALELDNSAGEEILIATRCPQPFGMETVTRADLPEDCTQVRLSLFKKAP
ncbi:MAG TPA: hypothetical protein PLA94_17475 [Myxococcota bacterium]|nr:hypothetical protein [Myxococcota bacterium]